MKLVYVVIDGMADLPAKELVGMTPLEAAVTPNLDFLARKGKTGLMYTISKGVAPESDVAVLSILGYDSFKYSTGRGVLEAVGSGLAMKDGDLALRCNFATVEEGWRIVDRRAGRDLTNDESCRLAQSINEKLKLASSQADFEFKSTLGHRCVLVVHSKTGRLSGSITNSDPAYVRLDGLGVAQEKFTPVVKKCIPLDSSEEARVSAELVNEFVEKAHAILDCDHVNTTRVSQGKLKANAILTRDAGNRLPNFFDIGAKYHKRFSCLADMPVERGIAKLAGMSLIDLPPPSKDLRFDMATRSKKLLDVLHEYDCAYIHIKGPDEPGHDGNCALKRDVISIIDSYFFGELVKHINLEDSLICVTADHATPCTRKAHTDDPVPVLVCGRTVKGNDTEKFSEKECRKGSLGMIHQGTQLVPLLMSILQE